MLTSGFCITCVLVILWINPLLCVEVTLCVLQQEKIYMEDGFSLPLKFEDVVEFEDSNLSLNLVHRVLQPKDFPALAESACSILNSSCLGLISVADCTHAEFLDRVATNLALPHVAISRHQCPLHSPYGVTIASHYVTLNDVIAAIVKKEEWSEVAYLYDSAIDDTLYADLLLKLSSDYVATMSKKIVDVNTMGRDAQIEEFLEELYTTQSKHVVVVGRESTVKRVFEMANTKSLLDSQYYWMVSSDLWKTSLLASLPRNGSNILVVRPENSPLQRLCRPCIFGMTQSSVNTLSLQLYDALSLYTVALSQASVRGLQAMQGEGSLETVACSSAPNDTALKQELRLALTAVDEESVDTSEINGGWGISLPRAFEIRSAHDVGGGFALASRWTVADGLEDSTLFKNEFLHFNNRTITVGTWESPPFVMKYTDANGVRRHHGFCIDILNELALRLQFNYILVEPPDRKWGASVNGVWNGIVGMVLKKEVDLGVGPFTLTSEREQVIDFTTPFMEDGVSIITKNPDDKSQQLFRMFTPLAYSVWLSIVGAVVLVGVTLFLVDFFSPYSARNKDKDNAKAETLSLKTSMWLIYTSYLEQGGDPHPRSLSGRCVLGFWWLFTILMASTYTANLAAFLTVAIARKPINSLAELVAQTQIKPLIKSGSNLETLFREANSGTYRDVWNAMDGGVTVFSNNEAVAHVRSGQYAFMTDRSQLEYIVLNDCKTYALADETFNSAGLGFIMPENAPFASVVNYNIMKMQEGGLLDKWKQRWWPSSDKCSSSARASEAATLGLDGVGGIFLVYLGVTGLAFLCLGLELVVRSSKNCGLWRRIRTKAWGPRSTSTTVLSQPTQ